MELYFLVIGMIVGIVMGLTGSGGALVSIPLFMVLMKMDLKVATSLSLMAVILASIFNFIIQQRWARYREGWVIAIFSFLGSYYAVPLKKMLPNFAISILLIMLSLLSLWNIWKQQKNMPHILTDNSKFKYYSLLVLSGIFLGVLTTLTGLGGGVLLVPLMMSVFSYSEKNAVATSLFIITISATASLYFQIQKGFLIPPWENIFIMGAGVLMAALALAVVTKKIALQTLTLVRKITFTAVVILALIKFLPI